MLKKVYIGGGKNFYTCIFNILKTFSKFEWKTTHMQRSVVQSLHFSLISLIKRYC